ncbi:MAG TPA: adenylate/guanylate cyclase domain-containing protein [Actinomycetota bacterium]|nr:adenylate/guanylate cyclase domain-containing protein [Actinomycetota bacterium]
MAAVWFADIVGYGRLASRNENEALEIVRLFQRTCRDVVRRYDGRVVKFTGDGALAEFHSTESAVRAACGLESAVRARAEAGGLTQPQLHIGLHVGEIASAPDGDLYGEGLNLASRLEGLAGPGQVLVSEDVRRQLHQRPEFRFIPLGEREIPDSDEPIAVYCVVERSGAAALPVLPDVAPGPWRSLHRELARRGVYRAAVIHLIVAGVAMAAAVAVLDRAQAPSWAARAVALLAVLGFPVVLWLAWTYEIGRGGLRRHEPGTPDEAPARPLLAFVGLILVVALIAGAIVFVQPPLRGELPELPMNRIAVLYFDDLSPDGRLRHLVDGLTESLIHDLSGVPGIEVVSRNGVKPFENASVPPDSVARALGAGTLVQGSVDESDGRLRVRVQLIDGRKGTVLESESLERAHGDLFALQDELTERVGGFLRRQLGAEIRLVEMRAETDNVRAWELVHQAEGLKDEAQPLVQAGALAEAGRLFERADSLLIEAHHVDSLWVQPVVQRGWLAYERSRWTENSDMTASLRWNEEAARIAEAALRLGPGDPEALNLRGSLRVWRAIQAPERDPAEADAQLDRAIEDLRGSIEADPRQAGAWSRLSWGLAARGDRPGAREAARRAYEADAYLDEANEIIWRGFSTSYDLEEADEAERWCEEGRRRFPADATFVSCHIWLLTMPGASPPPDSVWALLDAYDRLVPPHAVGRRRTVRMGVAAALARAGLADSALAVATRARAGDSDLAGESAYFEAFVRTLVGQEESATRLLADYLRASPAQRHEVAVTWWFEPLHDRPDFQALVGETRQPGGP